MITLAVHEVTGPVEPAGITLALAVASELHGPVRHRTRGRGRVERAPEVAVPQVAVPQLMGLRRSTAAAGTHRRKVPLNRLTAVMS
jgi:hypothetical protein